MSVLAMNITGYFVRLGLWTPRGNYVSLKVRGSTSRRSVCAKVSDTTRLRYTERAVDVSYVKA